MAGSVRLNFSGTIPGVTTVQVNNLDGTAASIFTDKTGASSATNPVLADGLGNFSFWAAAGDYNVVTTIGDSVVTLPVSVREDPAFTEGEQSLAPSGTTLAIDAAKGSIVKVSPTGSIATTTVTHLQVGQRFVLDFVSDGTHTFAYPTVCKFAGGAAGTPTSTSGHRDRYEFIWDGTNLIEVARSLDIS